MKHLIVLALGLALPSFAAAQSTDDQGLKTDADIPVENSAPTLTLYGSLRAHATYVSVDEAVEGKDESEFGLTDAYSRIGTTLGFDLGETTVTAKAELGLNTTDLELGDPAFFDDEDLRIYSVTASGDWGSLKVGKDWLPYYNNVGYPVDYFSSIYAGYTTFAFFRERQIAYTSPMIGGFTGTIAAIKRTGGGPSGAQGALSWSKVGLTFTVGFEEMESGFADTRGASASYTTGPWYLSAKIEDQDGQGTAYNVYAQRSLDKWTLKAGAGLGDQYSGDTFHLGVDYQAAANWTLFAEAYSEQLNYALLFDGAETSGDYLGAGGFGVPQDGKALLVGARFDFSTK